MLEFYCIRVTRNMISTRIDQVIAILRQIIQRFQDIGFNQNLWISVYTTIYSCAKKKWVIPHDLILRYFYCRREVANKEEELEDVRAAAQKKVKALEQQLENEHEERINFVREKHELETRIINLQEMASRSADEEQVSKLKRDLKRTKALLKDAQLMVEKSRNESSNKVVLRQLKNQVRQSKFKNGKSLLNFEH